MDHFQYRGDRLYAEEVPLDKIAETYGTPCYAYSRATLERHWHAFDNAFEGHPHLVCFAVKANSNLAVLNLLARLGSGFDIVSVGELERVLAAGGDPGKVLFSGVGKRADEMRRALEVGIRCFNVESAAELERLDQVAGEMGVRAPVALRVNPDVDAKTHPYISTGLKENKFGVDIDQALEVYRRAAELPNLEISGVDCHIGSQLTQVEPFLDALDRLMALVETLESEGIHIDHLDLGGGLGIRYTDEQPPEPAEYAQAMADRLGEVKYEIFIEPGRAIAGNAGVLLTRVEYLKHTEQKDFALIDAAMNDLLRPTLYQAHQEIIPVVNDNSGQMGTYDLVGPICETGDFLGKERKLSLAEGDLLAVRSSGAYGFTMSSNYNTRPRVPEVMVDGDQVHLVRKRETIEELYRDESVLP
ncbi:diaminopimelate decarboxylase [Solemya velesiana gill symbiont]|uniref:Diaminopimelate decarboxylase n=1 Tax=Solemya velesiana gill symbiont TaxID=1918948 RepID=A0A1T2KTC5_9GAMM|nr:diaminopimelate decarboxylase [Solemya velesiana gill symbiont]OOZ36094.1 diaminopimelate decarboxylase [Solemya velesiana gill symbiont]